MLKTLQNQRKGKDYRCDSARLLSAKGVTLSGENREKR
ncbi:hypothetical protein BN126_3416 [Cronobacter sakazakii 680]|nr:hypothetical protein BN126_3416 [Cronobacter sakazakii 680]